MKHICSALSALFFALTAPAAHADRIIEAAAYTVAAGASQVVVMGSSPVTVTAIPGGGGTMTIYATTSPRSAIDAGTANWVAWPAGAVAVATQNTAFGVVTGIKCTAAVAPGSCEIAR